LCNNLIIDQVKRRDSEFIPPQFASFLFPFFLSSNLHFDISQNNQRWLLSDRESTSLPPFSSQDQNGKTPITEKQESKDTPAPSRKQKPSMQNRQKKTNKVCTGK